MAKIATADLKPVWLILSESPLLVDQAMARLRSNVAEEADLDFNSEVFDADTASADAIIAACNTLPFAAERRLVVVKNVHRLGKDVMDALAAYCADPAPTTVLAITGAKLAKNTRLYKAVAAVGGVLQRDVPRGAEFINVIRDLFASRGKTASREAAETLAAAVGRDLTRISTEVGKVSAFVGERDTVESSDVEEVISTTAPTSVFELLEALGDRDCARSLRLAGYLIGQGESVFGLHAMALRQLRELMIARALVDRGGGSANELASVLGRPDWQVKRLPRQARSFTAEELVGLLRSAAESEAQMKTSRDARLVFERWIVRFCG